MANTCSNVLHLPLHPISQDVNYKHFKEMMSFEILNSLDYIQTNMLCNFNIIETTVNMNHLFNRLC